MFKMGSLLAFGTVYLLMHMHMCAWAQETSEESSNIQTASGQIGEYPPQSVFPYDTIFPGKKEYRYKKKARNYMVNDAE
ncbi:hypothetical protein ABFA07_002659 [Porites harrisoni]